MNEEIKSLDIQMIATIGYILSLLISLFLTYNSKTELLTKKPIISSKNSYYVSILNRIIVLFLSLVFLYINFEDKNRAQKKGEDVTFLNLQITASDLSVLAAIIVLSVVVESGQYSIITSVENPSL